MPGFDRRRLRPPSLMAGSPSVPEWRTIRPGVALTDASGGDDDTDIVADHDGPTDGTPAIDGTPTTDGSGPATDDQHDTGGSPIEFVDCETVRVGGEFDDVVLSLFWWDAEGLVGTIAEPVGGVDGERTIVAPAEFGDFAYGPIVSGVDAYRAGTPVVPGGGDVSVANPDVESCVASVRDVAGDEVELEGPFPE
ncbi:hypothetical protein [Halosolutus halophilus]|uniref:hypothetical protein n=1 Tax=Halosolutus halophilus TaxID=1552990 RepID=UPI002234F9ED|nr:hypothetical protein [Halosolutus halophilus]